MLLGGLLWAFLFAVLNVALNASAETFQENLSSQTCDISPCGITPVDLNHRCFTLKNEEQTKSPILLLHGMIDSLQTWSGIMETLAIGTGRRVCALDLRDHGDSPHTDRIDIEALAKDIEHFVDKEGMKKVNLVGHSLGAKTAVHFTLNNPERVDSLVSEDMRPNIVSKETGDTIKPTMELLKESIKSVPEGASEDEARKALLKFWREKLTEWGVKEIDEAIVKHLAIRQVNGKWEWKANVDLIAKAVQDWDTFLTKSTGVYRGPTLFIYGTKSHFDVPGDKENIMKLFPNAKLVPVEGAGHNIHRPYQKPFTDAVIKMINEIE